MNNVKLCMIFLLITSHHAFPRKPLKQTAHAESLTVQNNIDDPKQPDKELWINVFIHGSFSLRPHLTIKNMIKMAESI